MYTYKEIIPYCKKYFSNSELEIIKRNLKYYKNSPQYEDMLYELIFGIFFKQLGNNVKPSKQINELTPDWVIYDNNQMVKGIVEVKHLHIDQKTNNLINKQLEKQNTNEPRIATFWEQSEQNLSRLIRNLTDKAKHYEELSEHGNIPLIIAAYINFKLDFDDDEIENLLIQNTNNFFTHHDYVNGVLIAKQKQRPEFTISFWENPTQSNKLNIPKNYELKL